MSDRTCKIEGCNEDYHARGWCNTHYQRWLLHGDPNYCSVIEICQVEGCEKDHHAKGFCSRHYLRYKNHGDPLYVEKTFTHGATGTPLYNVWRGMKRRCSAEREDEHPRYAGRGISVCERWKDDFAAFRRDMGERPSAKHQIDRIDNDGDYTPENCRWVTNAVNSQNSSSAKLTASEVIEMREIYAAGEASQRVLGERYKTSRINVSRIVNGKRWANVGGPIKNEDY